MPALLTACDLMVGKCGGLTVAENAALGVPLIIVDPIPGQESRNADILLQSGGAVKCNDLCLIGRRVDDIFKDGGNKLTSMREGIDGLKYEESAYTIADSILEEFKSGSK
jgi:processive 1,2-diacylglycerol beta-glucosyltransferase